MHEYSLVQALLEQVDVLRREHNAERVVAIRVSVGHFSGVEPELFRMAFETMIDNTPAQGAVLEMEQVALAAQCDACDHEFAIDRFHFECPACHSKTVTVVRGEDLMLESVTMEQAETNHERANC